MSSRQLKGFECAIGPHAQCLDPVSGIVHRAGWTRKVKDVVDRATWDRGANVVLKKFEAGVIAQMLEVGKSSGEEIVGGHHRITFSQQSVAEMRSEEARSPRDQRASVFHEIRRSAFCRAGSPRSRLRATSLDDPRCNKRSRAPT